MTGIIIKGIGGFYYVKSADGEVVECRARGLFRKEKIKPMIGDRVMVENGSLVKIEERKNYLIRPPVANIDNIVIVSAAASPDPNFMLIDKMTVNAEMAGIKPIICINKTDLMSEDTIKKIYSSAGYPVVVVCAKNEKGIEELMPYLKGKTTAFAGLSGVGKSSILNLITDSEMETGVVSDKIQRGKHTTRHVELLELKQGGFVLDTPGFSSLELEGIKADELKNYFMEIGEGDCRFKGCSHINEPGCSVKERLENGEISAERYKSYCELYELLKQIKDWEQKGAKL